MTDKRSWVATARRGVASGVVVAASHWYPGRAAAEKVLVNADGWQIFTDGRAGGFVSTPTATVTRAQIRPRPDGHVRRRRHPAGGRRLQVHQRKWAGHRSQPDGRHPDLRPGHDQSDAHPQRVRLQHLRLRCSGQAHRMDHAVGLHAVLVVHRERRSAEEPPEPGRRAARLGEAGRPLGQLHRRPGARAVLAGNTDIDVLYAHRWGVGWPGAIGQQGALAGTDRVRRPRRGIFGPGWST